VRCVGAIWFRRNQPLKSVRYRTIYSALEQKHAAFELAALNLTQINTGAPFPSPNTIHFVNFYATLKLNVDFNKLKY